MVSRVCEEFHLSVRQALVELALPDLDEFGPDVVAEESAALMFEVMEYRASVGAKRTYESAKPEDQAKMATENPMLALVHEMTFEAGIEKVRAKKARKLA